MRSSRKAFLFAALLIVFAGACRRANLQTRQANVSGPAAAVQTTTYHGSGVVKSVDLKRPSIEIEHVDIPGLMPAMTMEFYVKDKSLLKGIQPGNQIEFTTENGVGGLKITQIKKL